MLKLVKVLSENQLFDVAPELDKLNYYFRGQADASWHLTSTLERACGLYNGRFRSAVEPNETKILQAFREYAENHPNRVPPCNLDDKLECLAVLQHYGAPTRMIDFTESFLTALFFAMEEAHEYNVAAIWCLNHQMMQLTFNEENSPTNRTADAHNNRKYHNTLVPCVLPINTTNKCLRHNAQKGLFLFTTYYVLPFEQELTQQLRTSDDFFNLSLEEQLLRADDFDQNVFSDAALVKILIPCGPNRTMRKRIMKKLKENNISRASLFPDFDGFARSLYSLTQRDIY